MASDLKRKFLYQSLLASSQLLFPLITYPYLARTLGAEGIGKVNYIEFVAGFIITVFAIGIPYYGVREIAKARDDKQRLSKLTGQLILIHLLCSLLGIMLFVGLLFVNPNFSNENGLILLGSCYILFQVFTIEWYLQGTEAFEFVALRGLIIRILGIGAIFLFVHAKEDYIIYYIIILCTQIAVAFTAITKAAKDNKIVFGSIDFRTHAKPLFYFFLTSSFISLYVFLDTIILGYLTDKDHVGYYTFSLRIIRLPLTLLLTLSTILYPRISYLQSAGDEERITSLHKFTIQFIITITIPVCLCFYLLAPEIISVLGGKDFDPSIDVLRLLAPLPLFISFTNFFILQVLSPAHKERSIMLSVLIACVISISLNLLLIPSLKEQGAAIAALITEGAVFLLSLSFCIAKLSDHFSITNILITALLSALSIPLIYIARKYLDSPLYILIASLAIFGIVYALLQYFVFKNHVIKTIVNTLTNAKRV